MMRLCHGGLGLLHGHPVCSSLTWLTCLLNSLQGAATRRKTVPRLKGARSSSSRARLGADSPPTISNDILRAPDDSFNTTECIATRFPRTHFAAAIQTSFTTTYLLFRCLRKASSPGGRQISTNSPSNSTRRPDTVAHDQRNKETCIRRRTLKTIITVTDKAGQEGMHPATMVNEAMNPASHRETRHSAQNTIQSPEACLQRGARRVYVVHPARRLRIGLINLTRQ